MIAPIRAKKLTLIGAIAVDGVRGAMEVEGSMDGDAFKLFLDERLGPNLHPGDVVVMDRLRAHQVPGVEAILAKWGASALCLPPYSSPEYNHIQICWAWIKRYLRKVAPSSFASLRAIVSTVWAQVTPALCESWATHCGYALASATHCGYALASTCAGRSVSRVGVSNSGRGT